MATRGVSKETTIVGLSEGAARPLFTEKDSAVKEKAIEKIAENLKGQQTVINEQNVKQGAGRGNKKEQKKGKGRGHKKKLTTLELGRKRTKTCQSP